MQSRGSNRNLRKAINPIVETVKKREELAVPEINN